MTPKKLRVRARGDALVQDHERLAAGTNAFIGRTFAPLAPTEDGLNAAREAAGFDADSIEPGQWGFIPTSAEVTVPNRAEYIKALKDGDLLAADDATAKAAGVEATMPSPPNALHDMKPYDAKDGDR